MAVWSNHLITIKTLRQDKIEQAYDKLKMFFLNFEMENDGTKVCFKSFVTFITSSIFAVET